MSTIRPTSHIFDIPRDQDESYKFPFTYSFLPADRSSVRTCKVSRQQRLY